MEKSLILSRAMLGHHFTVLAISSAGASLSGKPHVDPP